jgi:hypothetical protein
MVARLSAGLRAKDHVNVSRSPSSSFEALPSSRTVSPTLTLAGALMIAFGAWFAGGSTCTVMLVVSGSLLAFPSFTISCTTNRPTLSAIKLGFSAVSSDNAALKAAWYQKWLVHRRLRPEEFGGRVHQQKTNATSYPIAAELLNSAALSHVFARYGTYLLPVAHPEGCPIHPTYPAGHATIAGACVTVLKAFFKETLVIPAPVEASADGLTLTPYVWPALTLGGELDKLASNISLGRDAAGLHWRSDGIEGMKLGEAVAISILIDESATYNEDFTGFSLTKFDGTVITV